MTGWLRPTVRIAQQQAPSLLPLPPSAGRSPVTTQLPSTLLNHHSSSRLKWYCQLMPAAKHTALPWQAGEGWMKVDWMEVARSKRLARSSLVIAVLGSSCCDGKVHFCLQTQFLLSFCFQADIKYNGTAPGTLHFHLYIVDSVNLAHNPT